MSVESVSESVETLLKQIFKGADPCWTEGGDASVASFLDGLNFHGLAPVFSYWINQHGFCKDWPDSLLSAIKNIAMQEVASDMLVQVELNKVLQALLEIDIQPVLLKGTPLSFSLYPQPGLRPRCDTDFLIAKEDMTKVSQLMEQLGYESLYDADVEFISTQSTFEKQGSLGQTYAYDIHWQINNNSRSFSAELNYSHLLSTSKAIPRLGQNARTPDKVDALLLACFHRAGHFSHMGDRLIWLYDIHLLVGALDEYRFDLFYQKSKKMAIATICSDAILTAQDWFNTSLTEAILERLSKLPASEPSTAYLTTGRQAGIKHHALLELKDLSSLREKLRYFYQKVFPPVNYMLWRYDTKRKYLLPFLYLYRLIYGVYIFVRR